MTEDELTRLYSEYGYILFRRCLAYFGDIHRAQDALQDVFVRALHGAEEFRGESSARTWLCRIADHVCIDRLRRDRRNPVTVRAGTDMNELAKLDDLRAVAPTHDGEALQLVRSLMQSLDPWSQRLAVLHFIDELSQEQIATELGVSRRTIGKRLKALRARARDLLAPENVA